MATFKVEDAYKQSVHKKVDLNLKNLAIVKSNLDTFYYHTWKMVKTPKVALMPTFVKRHRDVLLALYRTAYDVLASNDVYNMCVRMVEMASLHSTQCHETSSVKRQEIIKAYTQLSKGILFEEHFEEKWDSLIKNVATKEEGFEIYLLEFNKFIEDLFAVMSCVGEAMAVISNKMLVTSLTEEMVKYYRKIEDDAEEKCMA